MRQMTINVSQQFAEWPNLETGQLPKVMLLTMTQSEALLGSHNTNPFFFHHFDLMHLSAEIYGKVYPADRKWTMGTNSVFRRMKDFALY